MPVGWHGLFGDFLPIYTYSEATFFDIRLQRIYGSSAKSVGGFGFWKVA